MPASDPSTAKSAFCQEFIIIHIYLMNAIAGRLLITLADRSVEMGKVEWLSLLERRRGPNICKIIIGTVVSASLKSVESNKIKKNQKAPAKSGRWPTSSGTISKLPS